MQGGGVTDRGNVEAREREREMKNLINTKGMTLGLRTARGGLFLGVNVDYMGWFTHIIFHIAPVVESVTSQASTL